MQPEMQRKHQMFMYVNMYVHMCSKDSTLHYAEGKIQVFFIFYQNFLKT